MDFSHGTLGLDMNDPMTLGLYTKVVLFKNDLLKEELVIDKPENSQQRILQSCAHMLELEYEYSVASRSVRITRVADSTVETGSATPKQSILTAQLLSQDQDSMSLSSASLPPLFPEILDWNFGCEDNGAEDLWQDFDVFKSDALQDEKRLSSQVSELLSRTHTAVANITDDDLPPWSISDLEFNELATEEGSSRPCSMASSSSALSSFSSPTIFSQSQEESEDSEDDCSTPTDATSFGSFGTVTSMSCSVKSIDIPKRKTPRYNYSIPSQPNSFASSTNTRNSRPSSSKRINIPRRNTSSDNVFGENSCMQQRSYPGFEFVFGSQPSSGSLHESSRRRGPLDITARATMNAVRAVGACWRCKFLRKPCGADTPCDACPKGCLTSNWGGVGCKRGDLKDEVPPTALCPHFEGEKVGFLRAKRQKQVSWETANFGLRKSIERRDDDIAYLKAYASGISSKQTHFEALIRGLEYDHPIPDNMPLGVPVLQALRPLDDCILAILWEALVLSWSPVIPDVTSLGNLYRLLRAAAIYQSKEGNNYLIAQSLNCLRLCLEAMHGKTFGSTNPLSHASCSAKLCNVDSIQILEAACQNYLAELSSVFFKKENLRDHKSWWLSAFYSFCIQAYIRKALMVLEVELGLEPRQKGRYLHIAVRLFIASSGKHDPLIQSSESKPDKTVSNGEREHVTDYELAQISVRQAAWAENGIAGSGDYLKQLFEDDGAPLDARASWLQ